MLKLFARRLIILAIGIAMSIIIARLIGQQFNPYQHPLSIYYSVANEQIQIIFDPLTLVSQSYISPISANYNRQENTWLGISYRHEWRDDVVTVYIERDGQEDQIGTFYWDNRQIRLFWQFDDDKPLYIIFTDMDTNTITMYQMDIRTGESTLFGTFSSAVVPSDIYISADQHLFIVGLRHFLVINLDTGASYEDNILGYPFNASYDRQYLQYSRSKNPANVLTLDIHYYLLDLTTYEVTEIVIPEEQAQIKSMMLWSPVSLTLPYVDENDQVWLYDVPSQSASPLPTEFRHAEFNYSIWSPDGQSIVLLKVNADEPITYGLYHLDTQDFTPLFNTEESLVELQGVFIYQMTWSPDETMILIHNRREATYQIYDASTGNLLIDDAITLSERRFSASLNWGYIPR